MSEHGSLQMLELWHLSEHEFPDVGATICQNMSFQMLELQHLSEHEFPDVGVATSVQTRQPSDVGAATSV